MKKPLFTEEQIVLPCSRPNWGRLCRRPAANWESLMPRIERGIRDMAGFHFQN